MPTGKKKSKRMSLRKKYKIEKKVREHHREQRREARKNPLAGKKLKKDPGVPNLWPLKEEFLHKLENYKAKLEQEKDRQKQQRLETLKKMREKKTAPSMQALAREASQRDKEFEKREELEESETASMWDIKDNSKRAYYREFKKIVEMSDVILEVLDARDPLGCRCPGVEQKILSKHPNKKIILILNKIDLVPRQNVESWLKFLRNEFPTVAFKCSTQDQAKNLGHSHVAFANATKKVLESSECLGADTLIQLLKNYCRNLNIKTSLSVGIIGYPNVGKSSLINSLKRSKAVGVGSTPGFTKTVQQIQLDKQIKLLDSPGIVFNEKSNDSDIVLRNAVKIEQIPDPIEPVELILKRCQKQQLMLIYEIANFENVNEFLIHISQKRGLLKKGGVSNMVAAARSVLQDWNAGKIAFYTIPPKNQNIHISAEIVQQWSKEFDLAAISNMEHETMNSLPQNSSEKAMAMAPGVSVESSDLLEDETMQDQEEEGEDVSNEDEESGEDEAEAMNDEEEPVPEAVPIVQAPPKAVAKQQAKKQALRDKEDKFNPQTNAQRKKDFKKMQKLKKKGKHFDWDDNSAMNDNNDVNNNDDDENLDDMEDL